MADIKTEKLKNNIQNQFGNVIITLENCTIPSEKLYPTPSVQDGLDLETETDLRILGCEFIQTAGILLKLPQKLNMFLCSRRQGLRMQVAMATGQVIFQRFYYSKSFVKHNMEVVAMACINLASKIEESPRRIRDVINVFHHVRQKRNGRTPEPMVLDQKYINMKNHVIKAERRVLKELGFCVHVKHPHKMIVTYLQFLECERNAQLVQTAWNYMNDSLKTDVFVRFPPETIACACIYLTARQLEITLPSNPPWYGLMGGTTDELEDIALTILRLYTRPKKSYEELDKIVDKRRVAIQERKLMKTKGQADAPSTGGTPDNFSPHNSRPSSPKIASNSPGLPNQYKFATSKLKEDPKSTESGNTNKNARERNGHAKVKHRQGGGSHSSSDIQSISPSPRRNSHSGSHSHSHSDHSRGSSTSRSRSRSVSSHDGHETYIVHSKIHANSHRRKEEHKRSHRMGTKSKRGRLRKRKRSRSISRSRSETRSRSRSPRRSHKHRYSPYRDSHKPRDKHLRSRSRSRERSHKVPKRDSGRRRSRSHSRDGRRRR